jgi:hypothetical protein
MPCSVATSISTSGADGITPMALRSGRFNGALTARTLMSRTIRFASLMRHLSLA